MGSLKVFNILKFQLHHIRCCQGFYLKQPKLLSNFNYEFSLIRCVSKAAKKFENDAQSLSSTIADSITSDASTSSISNSIEKSEGNLDSKQQGLNVFPKNVPTFAQSNERLTPPVSIGCEKQYKKNISDLVDAIANLTLVEVGDLNELLKKRLNLPDTPMVSYGAMQPIATSTDEKEDESAAPVVSKKTSFAVKLVKYDETKKISLIKEIKNLVSGLNLVQAKKFVESAPQIIKADMAEDEANKLKESLALLGGECTIE